MSMSLIMVMTTIDSKKAANKLAKKIIQAKLAACVNISSPIISHYSWQQTQHKNKEYLLLIKTVAENFIPLKDFIQRQHHYETAEIISLKINQANSDYFNWVIAATKPTQ